MQVCSLSVEFSCIPKSHDDFFVTFFHLNPEMVQRCLALGAHVV